MRLPATAALLAFSLAACRAHLAGVPSREPLDRQGEVYVYLQPLPPGAAPLPLAVEAVGATRAEGAAEPLILAAPDGVSAAAGRQRLLAWGRLPPGSYAGITLALGAGPGAPAAPGAAPVEPQRLPVPFGVGARRAVVLWVTAVPGRLGAARPDLTAAVSRDSLPQGSGYCTSTTGHGLAVIDKHTRLVTGFLPTGAGPEGVAVDLRQNRAYVAVSGDDLVAVFDLNAREEVARIPLGPGDRPREVGLTPDGRTLVVVNRGSATAAFVDTGSLFEVGRVATGDQPGPLLVDRSGQRAYVLNQGSASITVLDLPRRALAATVRTEPRPVRADLGQDGTRLYVAHAGSSQVLVLSVPGLAVTGHLPAGMGVSTLRVDPRTDLVYVGNRDRARLQVLGPQSLMPVSEIDLPGPPSRIAIDDGESVLFATLPESRALAAVDLASGKLLGVMDLGGDPYQLALAGERR